MTRGHSWSTSGSYSVYGDSERHVAAIEYKDGRYKLWIRADYWVIQEFYGDLETAKAVAVALVAMR